MQDCRQDTIHFLPRCDYKEFLELAKLLLGGSLERKNGYTYTVQRPGADHHARWMSKAIYILKMVLLQHQLPQLHWQTKKKVTTMSLFVVFVYLEYWFTAPHLFSASSNDLKMWTRLLTFKRVHRKVSNSAATVLRRHTWYLTEDLISLALFDDSLPESTRDTLAQAIGQLPPAEIEIRKPTLPDIHSTSLVDYVGERSRLVFDLLKIDPGFLLTLEWRASPEYESAWKSLSNLSPLNDSTERALALATNFNTKIARTEESFQDLLQVVDDHRKKYTLKTKKDLEKLY